MRDSSRFVSQFPATSMNLHRSSDYSSLVDLVLYSPTALSSKDTDNLKDSLHYLYLWPEMIIDECGSREGVQARVSWRHRGKKRSTTREFRETTLCWLDRTDRLMLRFPPIASYTSRQRVRVSCKTSQIIFSLLFRCIF